ncbi:MAG: cob(I)yrinic acid a,c-diamide adenosyltransferase [Anaerolineae bacterium]|jgi:cob(I)alamin adenosyltransferase|nr:cob(I)yrinic acid a,c-diamide adenosyltransferase [Anaerolineae bacterium]MCZ7552946.1 cob(I)yrinic acid a,c-diamide adenosyltransferase [Anaerolineales bacterium]
MSRFYTTAGDDGFTGTLRKGRLRKDDPQTEALGAIDEANSTLGLARSVCRSADLKETLLTIQGNLYQLMTEISASPDNAARFRKIDASSVDWLERQIADLSSRVEVPKEFIVPGDSFSAAVLDLARAVVRRAERRVAGLAHEGLVDNPDLLRYLNRLSSLCFVMELFEIQQSGKDSPTLARALTEE